MGTETSSSFLALQLYCLLVASRDPIVWGLKHNRRIHKASLRSHIVASRDPIVWGLKPLGEAVGATGVTKVASRDPIVWGLKL